MQQGLLARISRSAVKEYHAFGVISYVAYHIHRGPLSDASRSAEKGDMQNIITSSAVFKVTSHAVL